ncbi:MAG: HDOD domain-containing protein [Candidatus Fibromonas sp.]|nr:HDOD domain-containing protein [Candidatus Fibromonas sp.]
MQTESVKKITQRLMTMSTLPTIAAQLLEVANDEKFDKESLERIISGDPVLAARLLKMTNANGELVTGIHSAINKLGFEQVKDICMEVSLSRVFELKNSGVDLQKFWEHCHAVGIVARIVASEYKFGLKDDEVFTAGLLHDFGKIVFLHYKSGEFEQAINLSKSRSCELYLAEREFLNVDHGQTGAELARKWLLPSSIAEVMQYHHDLAGAKVNRPLVALVSFADILCRIFGAGESGNHAPPTFTDELASELAKWGIDLELNALQPLMTICIDELDKRGL